MWTSKDTFLYVISSLHRFDMGGVTWDGGGEEGVTVGIGFVMFVLFKLLNQVSR